MPTYAVEPVMPLRFRSLPFHYLSLDVKEAPFWCNGLGTFSQRLRGCRHSPSAS
jgi:hypothetical protein